MSSEPDVPRTHPAGGRPAEPPTYVEEPGNPDSVWHAFFDRAGLLAAFAGRFFREVWHPPYEGRELIRQMDEIGSKSFLLVAITGFSTGFVMAMQARGTLASFGAESLLPDMVTIAVIKEFGPVFTAIVLAGRLGAGIVAEIGSMRVTEQIDAMEVAALKPFKYLVTTRVVACILMFPMLTVVTDLVAISGAYLESGLAVNADYRIFLAEAFSAIRIIDILVDTFKTSLFGLLVGLVSCCFGYTVRGGAREVGQAGMQAVVLSSLLILLADVVVVRVSIWLVGDVST